MAGEAGRQQRAVPFGPFVLERRIAVGGSAEVFLARPRTGQAPAEWLVVKRLLPSLRADDDYGFLDREARLHQAVVHPNVVRVFGAGMVAEEPYLAMEYVDGVDLYRLLRRGEAAHRRMPPALAAYVARCVAEALEAVHSAKDVVGEPLGIVHRDVTPSNVYLSIDGEVKLGDFGIARVGPRAAGQPTVGLKGKFGYLAPEQVAGEPFDHRADLFALGVLLGEMLIGERVFPGNGQLAVLLAIRDANIEPLRRAADSLPPALFAVCERALAREPNFRYQDARALADALAPFEQPSRQAQRDELSEWVNWARDASQMARALEGKIRDSVQRMRAVQLATKGSSPAPAFSSDESSRVTFVSVRRVDGSVNERVPFGRLLEWIATGELGGEDEVALWGADFQPISEVHDLARHLLPSTTATTSRLFEPGAPDFQCALTETPMLEVLARMRQHRESGALFVLRRDDSGTPRRKEIYLSEGRLHHVASSERAELLGEYLVRRGALNRTDLDAALAMLARQGGRLGDTLVGMGVVNAMDVFRAIRDQGRDRVAAICGWPEGTVTFYRGTAPGQVEFPLDLDLSSAMMAGVIVASRGAPRELLPSQSALVLPGPRSAALGDQRERGSAPMSLQLIAKVAERRVNVGTMLAYLTRGREERNMRPIGDKEASAALNIAKALGWIMFSESRPPSKTAR